MCGKVGKAIGGILGFGGGSSSAPTVPQADPVATTVNVGDDTSNTTDDATKNAKKKRGFAILGSTNGKNTLG